MYLYHILKPTKIATACTVSPQGSFTKREKNQRPQLQLFSLRHKQSLSSPLLDLLHHSFKPFSASSENDLIMPDSGGGGCCRCCCSFIFTLGLTALFMWLSLRTSSPDCLLSKFYIPLNQTSNLTTLEFELRLKNTNKDKGVYYDNISVTFFDSPNKSRFIGNFTISKFYQGHKKKATKNGTISNIDRQVVARAVPENGSTARFRVDLATSVRYKILMFKTKRHKIRVGGDVDVNGTVTKVNKKDLKLKSNADQIRSYWGQMGVLFVNFLVLGLLNFW